MLRRPAPRLALALAFLLISGCGGDGGRLPVYPAGGQVLLAGKPVARAIVRFHPVDPSAIKLSDEPPRPGAGLTAETESDGKFAMSTYLANDGVPAGEYAVTVLVDQPEVDIENGDGRPAPKKSAAIDATKIYRDRATTPLKATVKPGDNRFDFELK